MSLPPHFLRLHHHFHLQRGSLTAVAIGDKIELFQPTDYADPYSFSMMELSTTTSSPSPQIQSENNNNNNLGFSAEFLPQECSFDLFKISSQEEQQQKEKFITLNVKDHLENFDDHQDYQFKTMTFIGLADKEKSENPEMAKTSGVVPDPLLVSYWENSKTNKGKFLNWDLERAKRKLQTSLLRGIVEFDLPPTETTKEEEEEEEEGNSSYSIKTISVVEKDENNGNFLQQDKQILVLQNHKLNQLLFFDPISWKRIALIINNKSDDNKLCFVKSDVSSFSAQTFKNCISIRKFEKRKQQRQKREAQHSIVAKEEELVQEMLATSVDAVEKGNDNDKSSSSEEENTPVFSKLYPSSIFISITSNRERATFWNLVSQKINSNERRLMFKEIVSKSFANISPQEDSFKKIQEAYFDDENPNQLFHIVTASGEVLLFCFVWGQKSMVSPFTLLDSKMTVKSMQFSPRGTYLYIQDNLGNSYTWNL